MDVMELLKDYETMRRTGGIFLRDDTRKQITHKIMQGRGAQTDNTYNNAGAWRASGSARIPHTRQNYQVHRSVQRSSCVHSVPSFIFRTNTHVNSGYDGGSFSLSGSRSPVDLGPEAHTTSL